MTKSECKWYDDGLRFQCTQCGRCCAGAPGHVWVNDNERRQLADHLKMSVDEFTRIHTRRIGLRYSLNERGPDQNWECVFQEKQDGHRICSVYDVRPAQCRTWPFWDDNLSSRRRWREVADKVCPGMNRGGLHPSSKIESRRQTHSYPELFGDESVWSCEMIAAPVGGNSMDEQSTLAQSSSSTALPIARIRAAAQEPNVSAQIQALYRALDSQIARHQPDCRQCGHCCRFAEFGHRLYVTSLELACVMAGLKDASMRVSTECPFQRNDLCTLRDVRPVGCRVFFRESRKADWQNDLTEWAMTQLRSMHESLDVPYTYVDWLTGLKQVLSV